MRGLWAASGLDWRVQLGRSHGRRARGNAHAQQPPAARQIELQICWGRLAVAAQCKSDVSSSAAGSAAVGGSSGAAATAAGAGPKQF